MRLKVGHKLFLTLLAATSLVVAVLAGLVGWSVERGFTRYVEARQHERIESLVEQLAEVYAEDGSWDRLAANPRRWRMTLRGVPYLHARATPQLPWPRNEPRRWPPETEHQPPHRNPRFVPLELRVMLLDATRTLVYGRKDAQGQLNLWPIEVEGQVVGYLGVASGPTWERAGDLQFIQRLSQRLWLLAALVVLCSALLAAPVSKHLVRRLRRVIAGTEALAAGRYETRVPAESSDELGDLARDFNALAEALERTDRLRCEWMGDVAHELRTPLAVLRAEIEAVQDGVRPLDRQAADSLHTEVMRLTRLVEDLYQLAMSDLGALSTHKQRVRPADVLQADVQVLAGKFAERNIQVTSALTPVANAEVYADADRLSQLFRNLLQNSLCYTDSGGRLDITGTRIHQALCLDFQDSAPGVAATDLPRLFERFFRVERSRSRHHGGAGIGLALCRRIVEAHGGTIEAQAAPLGGLRILIRLPLAP